LESFSPIPWLCCGDFNEILDASETKGGARRPGTQMKEFQNALEHCRLCDTGFNGSRYTWSNKRHDDYFTKERLDRVVANMEFASLFPRLCVEVIAAGTSDHGPLFCSLQVGNEWGGKFSDLRLGGRKNMGLLRRSNRFGK
jgi:endonuclease/exonuclease/phosphatase family metal-dependent hydrolase